MLRCVLVSVEVSTEVWAETWRLFIPMGKLLDLFAYVILGEVKSINSFKIAGQCKILHDQCVYWFQLRYQLKYEPKPGAFLYPWGSC